MKKILSLLLCLVMLAALAIPGIAAQSPAALSGTAETAWIMKYGNVVLSLTKEELQGAGYEFGDVLTVTFLDQTLDLPLCSNYSDVDSGLPAVFARDKDANVILAINMGDFATTYGIAVKTTHEDKSFEWNWAEGVTGPVSFTIEMKQAGGYRDEYLLHQLSYTDDRADYPDLSDEEFANFRAVETTGMGKGVLYRTASPINPEHNRNTYADAAIRASGVTVVMNLADDDATARAYPGFDDSYYATTSFIALNMGVDFFASEFREKLAEGLRYLAEHPGVYAIHCTEGKDRAGFVVALLECLMGASVQEVSEDYMRTFRNYYGVNPGEERYEAVLNSGIVKSLCRAFGVDDLESADLAACAQTYLRTCGLTDETIETLKKNLSAAPAKEAEADGVLTRGEFIMGLFELSGEKDMEPRQAYFEDVPMHGELALAIRWAVGNGIVKGYGDGRFGPDDPVTREQMATMLYRNAVLLGQGFQGMWMFLLNYPDAAEISEWADEAMHWVVMHGILVGTDRGLEPKAAATDAQLTIVLDRWQSFLAQLAA